MKVYIAGSFVDQKELRECGNKLWALGHEITGSWLNEVARPEVMDGDTFKKKLAIKDIAEVYAADLIILDNRRSSGGKNCEWGIGLGQFQKKLLWLVGEESNVFQHLADEKFASWEEVYERLHNKG